MRARPPDSILRYAGIPIVLSLRIRRRPSPLERRRSCRSDEPKRVRYLSPNSPYLCAEADESRRKLLSSGRVHLLDFGTLYSLSARLMSLAAAGDRTVARQVSSRFSETSPTANRCWRLPAGREPGNQHHKVVKADFQVKLATG